MRQSPQRDRPPGFFFLCHVADGQTPAASKGRCSPLEIRLRGGLRIDGSTLHPVDSLHWLDDTLNRTVICLQGRPVATPPPGADYPSRPICTMISHGAGQPGCPIRSCPAMALDRQRRHRCTGGDIAAKRCLGLSLTHFRGASLSPADAPFLGLFGFRNDGHKNTPSRNASQRQAHIGHAAQNSFSVLARHETGM